MLDRADGRLLKAFGGESENDAVPQAMAGRRYRNNDLRIRSVFAKGDGAVLSGGEADKNDTTSQAGVFAWDVLSGEVVGSVDAGDRVKAVSCVAWNEKEKCWAGGCSDGRFASVLLVECC